MTILVMCAYPNSQVLILISYRMAYIIIIIITRMQYRSQLYAYINIWNIYIIIISIYMCVIIYAWNLSYEHSFSGMRTFSFLYYTISHTHICIYIIYIRKWSTVRFCLLFCSFFYCSLYSHIQRAFIVVAVVSLLMSLLLFLLHFQSSSSFHFVGIFFYLLLLLSYSFFFVIAFLSFACNVNARFGRTNPIGLKRSKERIILSI